MSICAVCASSNLQCWRCERISLKFEIANLKAELSKYYLIDNEKLQIEHFEKQLSMEYNTYRLAVPFHKDQINRHFDYQNWLSTAYFITITFDPAKFGMQPYPTERKEYILHKFYRLMRKDLVKKVYGSFEFHKNGIIHCHAIINAQNEDISKIKKELKPYFTDNMYNKIVIDIGPAKYPQAMEYIEKESEDYFLITLKDKKFNNINTKRKDPISIPYLDESSDEENPLDYGL